ncbi:MAG: SusC/RagA family TonB-linked outer membrane protein [Sphingobacterium sp.]
MQAFYKRYGATGTIMMLVTLFLIGNTALAQQTGLRGVVQDNGGIPIGGATIQSKNNPLASWQTDAQGRYFIPSKPGETLLVSSLGYKSQEFTVDDQEFMRVILYQQANQLDELVITAYGASSRRAFTGSMQHLRSEALSKTAAASFETALQGNASGVNIYTTGQPGGASNVQIRGVGSISGLREPLYVLDGIVMNADNNSRIGGNGAVTNVNPLVSINPADIESVTVLKDAAAASLYGSRAGNGVIVITTKQGQRGETQLDFTAQTGVLSNLTGEKTITNEAFKDLWEMGQLNSYIQNEQNAEYFRVYNDPALYGQYQAKAQKDYRAVYGSELVNSDWLDAIYRTGVNQRYSMSASGGGEFSKFYLSGDYLNQKGTLIRADLDRKSARLNLQNQAKTWLSIGANLSVASSKRNSGQYDGDYVGGLNPLYMARVLPQAAPIWDENGYMGIADLPNQIEKNANPIGVIQVGEYLNKDVRLRGNAFLELALPYDFTFKSTFGLDHQSLDESLYDNKEFGAGGGEWNGVLYVAQGQVLQTTSSSQLVYMKHFAAHQIDALLGFESQQSNMKSINNSGYDILDSELLSSSSIGTLWSWNGKSEDYSLLSYFSRVNYALKDTYYLSASLRKDGSSRFGVNSRWGTFWSVSGGWVLSQEPFLVDSPISFLKIRGSYGTNGNLPSEYYASLAFFTTAGKSYAQQSGLSYGQIANPDLSWELSRNGNIGVDMRIGEKIDFTAEYYHKTTDDLLLNVPVSLTTGFSNQLRNYGQMVNQGWELSLRYSPFNTPDLHWNVGVRAALLSNEITKLSADIIPTYDAANGQNPIITKVGESFNSFYLREYAGVSDKNGLAEYYVLEEGKRTGAITTDAQQAGFGVFGSALQKVHGGISSDFRYKKWDISVLFTYGIGAKAYDRTAFKRDDDGFYPQFTSTQAQLDPWTPFNANASVPIRINGNSSFSNDVSTRHLHSGDYLKLRNLRIGYNIPTNRYLRAAKIYLQGDNLLLWTQLNDYDPEAVVSGVNLFQTPTARSFMLGIQFSI